jgi:hypothetical protein
MNREQRFVEADSATSCRRRWTGPALHRSRGCLADRAASTTPRALGWDRIHFAVRHLAARAVWTGLSREERCLVLLRGEFDVSWAGASHRDRPARTTSSARIRTPSTAGADAVPDRRPDACEIADRARHREGPAAARHPSGRLRLRDSRRRQRDAADRRHPAAGVSGGPAAHLRGVHARRQLVVVSAAQARHRRPAAGGRSRGGLLLPLPDPNGYGFQRVYSKRRDDTLRVTHGDVVAVRDGYHPFVTAHGYDAYYLNVLAGRRRSMAASDDPRYAHFRREWPPPDPRLPLVPRP